MARVGVVSGVFGSPASSYTSFGRLIGGVPSISRARSEGSRPDASYSDDSHPDALATTRQRVLAYLADLVVVGGGVVAVAHRLGRSLRERALVAGILGLVVANLYHVVLEGHWGRTVGKRIAGIRVTMDDGSLPTVRAATIRTLARFVDWLPAGYLVGFVAMALTAHRQRLGDVAADTVVVRDAEEKAADQSP